MVAESSDPKQLRPEDRQPDETRTAYRKRRKLERANLGAALAIQQAISDRQRNAALRVTCSEFWMREHLAGKHVAPNDPCLCEHCRSIEPGNGGRSRLVQRLWPNNAYIGSVGISFECHIDASTPFRDDRSVSRGEAIDAGLHMQRRRAGQSAPITAMKAGCQGKQPDGTLCGGLRPWGEKYCLRCKKSAVKEMKEAGYL